MISKATSRAVDQQSQNSMTEKSEFVKCNRPRMKLSKLPPHRLLLPNSIPPVIFVTNCDGTVSNVLYKYSWMSHISKGQSGKINSFQEETGRYNSMHDCFVFSRTSYYLQFAIFSEKAFWSWLLVWFWKHPAPNQSCVSKSAIRMREKNMYRTIISSYISWKFCWRFLKFFDCPNKQVYPFCSTPLKTNVIVYWHVF